MSAVVCFVLNDRDSLQAGGLGHITLRRRVGLFPIDKFRAHRVEQAMEKYDLDLLVASLPEHILYLLNFTILGATYQTKTQNYAICSRNPAQPHRLVISPSDAPTAMEFSQEVELVCHGGFHFEFHQPLDDFALHLQNQIEQRYSSPADALIEAIRRCGANPRRIGIDELRTPVTTWNKVAAAFPNTELVPALTIFEEIRCVKHPDEIDLIERATHIAEDSLLSTLNHAKYGDSEYDLGMDYRVEVAKRNANGYFCTCTIDQRTAFSDTRHRADNKLADGSIIRFDFGALYQFYRSDLARTIVVGKANPQVEFSYQAIHSGLEEAIKQIRPGVTAGEVFDTAVKTVRKWGIPHYKRHHCGHGIGLQIYDPPSVSSQSETVLEPGMVLCIETPYYEIGKWGIQIEDTVAVTEDGWRRLSHTGNQLIKIF